MSIRSDCHVHTCYSGDSSALMRTQIESAIAAGLDHLTFTDHLDLDFPYHKYPELADGAFDLDIDAEFREFTALKAEYEDRIGLGFGLEAGLLPHLDGAYRSILSAHPEIEFVIGSVHLTRSGRNRPDDFVDPYYPSFFREHGTVDGMTLYLETLLDSIRNCSCFHSLGHLDYAIRYAPEKDSRYRYADYAGIIDAILELLIRRDQALELNTKAWQKGCSNPNPSRDILLRYREMGGRLITAGSDAHRPEDVASGLGRASELLRDCGYTAFFVYKNGVPQELPL